MKDDYKPKPGHVWRYQNDHWVEVPLEELDRTIPSFKITEPWSPTFEGPIVGFKGPNGLNETTTSYDATKEFLKRTLNYIDETTCGAVRFYEDVLLWRVFHDPSTGRTDPEVFNELRPDEVQRLQESFCYIQGLNSEEMCTVASMAIVEMGF